MKLLIPFLLCAAAWSQTIAPTTIKGPISTPFGVTFTGKLQVTAPDLICAGTRLTRWTQTYVVTAGEFATGPTLYPTDACRPAAPGTNGVYAWTFIGSDGSRYTQYFGVPTSSSPVAFSALSQLSATGMPWSGPVTSVNGATGAINLPPFATSGNYADLVGKPALAPVATSGSYADLTNKPILTPAAIGADAAGAATAAQAAAQAASVPLSSKGQPGGVVGIGADGNVAVGIPIPPTSGGTGCSGARCYYNMPRWRAKLESVRHGSGFARVGIFGDSTIFGRPLSTSTSVGVSFCADVTTYYGYPCHADSWIGGGLLGQGNYWQNDSRLTAGTGWANNTSIPTIGVSAMEQSASGANLSFTPTGSVDTCEVYYVQQPLGGTLNIYLDASTPLAINTAGVASMAKYTLTSGTVGPHTVNHAWASGGATDIVGNVCYDSTTPGVIVVLSGAGSSNSNHWANTSQPYSPGNSAPYSALGLDAVVTEAGLINDWFNFASAATSHTNMQTMASAILGAGADLAFYTPIPSITTTKSAATQATFVAAMRAVAAANKNNNSQQALPIIDINAQWGAQANHPSWYNSDGVHGSVAGYALNAQAVETALLQEPSQISGFNLAPWLASQAIAASAVALAPSIPGGAPYTIQCTESILYLGATTVTFPAACPNNYEVTIFAFNGAVTLVGSNFNARVVTALIPGSIETLQYLNDHWYPIDYWNGVSTTGLLTAAAIQFSTVMPTSGSTYTLLGTEGSILMAGGTLILGTPANGSAVFVSNYAAPPTTLTGIGNIPAQLYPSQSIFLTYYNGSWRAPSVSLNGVTGSIGGSALAGGACASSTASITGISVFSSVVSVSPSTYPGDGFIWQGYVSGGNLVTVKVCAIVAGTPTASTYNVRVQY